MSDIHRLDNWLKDNVLRVENPKKVTLHSFKIDWSSFSGSFVLELDGVSLESPFRLSLGIDGVVHFGEPIVHSPLGVPASYSAVEIDSETKSAIANSIAMFFPKFRAYGYHKDINLMVDSSSSLEERVFDSVEFKNFKSKVLDSNLKLSVIS